MGKALGYTGKSEMSANADQSYRKAVDYARRYLERFVSDNQLVTIGAEPSELFLRFQLRIKQNTLPDGRPLYEASQEAYDKLQDLSLKDRGAFDLYSNIVASRLVNEEPLDVGMRVFAAMMTVERLQVPKRSKKKAALFLPHVYIFYVSYVLSERYSIPLTRNDAGPEQSACDAISLALEELGHAKSPRAIKEILVGKSSRELRDAAICVHRFAQDWRKEDPDQAAEWRSIDLKLNE